MAYQPAARTEIYTGRLLDETETCDTRLQSEAQVAEWWYKDRAQLDKDLVEAAKKDQTTLKARLAGSKSRAVSIRVAEDEIKLARQQATEKGLPYQTYIKSVLHRALRLAK